MTIASTWLRAIATVAATLPGSSNLIRIKGVGPQSAAVRLAYLHEITDFNAPGKRAADVGIPPRVSQSHAHRRTRRITTRGRQVVQTGCRFSRNAAMPSLASSARRLSTMTLLAN